MHIGLVGIGAIGKEVVKRLKPFGCRMSYYDAFRPTPEVEKELDVTYLPFEELIRECDILSIHVPVLPDTFHMFSTEQFKAMKNSAVIVNAARGEIIDDMALAQALEAGEIGGAALDTVAPEPIPAWHPLLHLSQEAEDKLTFTPHCGGKTAEAFTRMLKWGIEDIRTIENGGKPKNIVNGL